MTYNAKVPIASLLEDHFAPLPKGAQTQAAMKMGVTPATVSRWRAGQVAPKEEMASQLAQLLGRSEDDVLEAIVLQRRLRPRPSVDERDELLVWRDKALAQINAMNDVLIKLATEIRGRLGG